MKNVNLLSAAEMKNIVGGVDEAGRCLTYQDFASCWYEISPGVERGGECGYSTNGKQCRCIGGPDSSVPWDACVRSDVDEA